MLDVENDALGDDMKQKNFNNVSAIAFARYDT